MKNHRSIVVIVAFLLGILVSTITFFDAETQMAINEPVTDEYYEFLKENVLQVAKTLDKSGINDETLIADFQLNETELVVTVESIKAKVTAVFPITNYSLSIDDGIIKSQGTVEIENAQYEEENKLPLALSCIVMSVVGGGFVAGFVYFIFYEAWIPKTEE